MLDPKEIDLEIARLEYGESSYPAYAKLAILYTIKNQMNRAEAKQQESETRSYELAYSSAPADPALVEAYGDSDFIAVISGLNQSDVWEVMDDLMDTLRVTNPRVYNGIIRRLRAL